jgi:hypothetical protein
MPDGRTTPIFGLVLALCLLEPSHHPTYSGFPPPSRLGAVDRSAGGAVSLLPEVVALMSAVLMA